MVWIDQHSPIDWAMQQTDNASSGPFRYIWLKTSFFLCPTPIPSRLIYRIVVFVLRLHNPANTLRKSLSFSSFPLFVIKFFCSQNFMSSCFSSCLSVVSFAPHPTHTHFTWFSLLRSTFFRTDFVHRLVLILLYRTTVLWGARVANLIYHFGRRWGGRAEQWSRGNKWNVFVEKP